MKNIYNSDKPILSHTEDKFKRYNFSKRIAETIINRKSEDGLVIGIYGAWGEGKTSILNILQNELELDENVIIIKFNPWRFTTEESLVINFLKNISDALDKQLNNLRERVGSFVKKYGSIGSVFNLDLSSVGNSLSDTDLEELKNRVNDFLKESKKKVVIIIDDIDRLDKQELFAIFKLVKLTGDFSNTYYLLSFDDEMVASAIGERYANGDKASGHNFLEKIIQVPLRIPKALSTSLLNYTFELINDVIKENNIILTENEGQHIGYLISQNILPKITTPRLAVRYANSLSFLLPLLKGEVNHCDLILFEAVKIFYPKHYDFIKNSSQYFLESYTSFGGNTNASKVQDFKNDLDSINNGLSKIEIKAIHNVLIELFPRINEALHNSFVHEGEKLWSKEKKIGSAKYFNRYFLYSLPDNQISDVYFEDFINSITIKTINDLSIEFLEIVKQIDPLEFLNKLSFFEENLGEEQASKLIELISLNHNNFPEIIETFTFGAPSPSKQAAITIHRLLKQIKSSESQIEIVKELLSGKVSFSFANELLRWLKVGKTEDEKLFDSLTYKTFNEIILERAISDCESNQITIFEKYEKNIFSLLNYWYEMDSIQLKDYVKNLIENNSEFTKTIIYSLTSTMYVSTSPLPYKMDFKNETFEMIKNFFDIDAFYEKVISKYKEEIEKEEAVFFDMDEGQTESNSLRQFVFWYKKDKGE